MPLFKALKHKVLIHTYGHFLKDFRDEIFYSEIPKLLSYSITMDELKEDLEEYPNALKELENYELIKIEIIENPK